MELWKESNIHVRVYMYAYALYLVCIAKVTYNLAREI